MTPMATAIGTPGKDSRKKDTSMNTCVLCPHSSPMLPTTKRTTGTITYQIKAGQNSISRNKGLPRIRPVIAAVTADSPEQSTPLISAPITKCKIASKTFISQHITNH